MLKLRNANAAVSWKDYINDPQKLKLFNKMKLINNLYNISRPGTDCATYAGLMAAQCIVDGNKEVFEKFTDPTQIEPWNQ